MCLFSAIARNNPAFGKALADAQRQGTTGTGFGDVRTQFPASQAVPENVAGPLVRPANNQGRGAVFSAGATRSAAARVGQIDLPRRQAQL